MDGGEEDGSYDVRVFMAKALFAPLKSLSIASLKMRAAFFEVQSVQTVYVVLGQSN